MRHNIEVVVDRLTAGAAIRPRLAEAVELALRLGEGNLIIALDVGRTAKTTEHGPQTTDLSADMTFSAHYACTHCGLSFESPSPQLFSFNSPQGMCRECDGLGEIYGFDVAQLIPRGDRSFKQGCIELVGVWGEMGRWRRHIYQGVADTVERIRGLAAGTMLETPWEKLPAALQKLWLWGTGDEHVTFTWRSGANGHKYGGRFEGIIPQLLARYRGSNSRIQRRQLEKYMSVVRCGACGGARLGAQGRSVTLATAHPKFAAGRPERSLPEVCALAVSDAAEFFSGLVLDATGQTIAAELLKEIRGRLGFLVNVGLDYLTLDRTAPTLSGGESQRIRLAGQIGCGLVGVLYILDEPSIGLHPRDNQKLLDTLTQLRDKGNTVVVVEHDEDTMRAADTIVDFGPGPGVRGGELVGQGTAEKIAKSKRSITGQYLSGKLKIEVPDERRLVRGQGSGVRDRSGVGGRGSGVKGRGTAEKWRLAAWDPERAAALGRGRNGAVQPPPPVPKDSAFATPALKIVGAGTIICKVSTSKSRWGASSV